MPKYFKNLSFSLTVRVILANSQSLSKSCKPANGIQLTVIADEFNEYFLSIPHNTITNVTSNVYQLVSLWRNSFKIDLCLLCSFVDVEIVSSIDVHKATGVNSVSPRFVRASPFMVRLNTILYRELLCY